MVEALEYNESRGGLNCGRGSSGENGCFQYLPTTWVDRSIEVLGYVAPQTKINEKYVTLIVVQSWLNEGYSVGDVALKWNQGNTGPCIAGTNSDGVEYNSCEYREKLLAYYHN